MKNLFFIFIFILSGFAVFAGDGNRHTTLDNPNTSDIHYAVQAPFDYASDITARIISVIGLKPNFEVKAAKVPNAAAVVYNRKRYVLYSPSFINALVKTAGNEWAAVSVLAHEIGHHLNGHTLENHGSRPDLELEADEFSGFVLRRMGASLPEAQSAMKIAANARRTATHPAKYDRLAAIENGWKNADNQILGKQDIAINKPRNEKWEEIPAPKRISPIDGKYIAANVHFNGDEQGEYYVTTRLNLVKVEDNKLSVIGKLSPVESKEFPFVIHDQKQTRLFVTRKGSILNARGKAVGYMASPKVN